MIWLTPEIMALTTTAAALGLLHTAIGPDHYLPFVMLSRARQWSARRTAAVTLACGLVHVAGSVLLGLLGVAAGLALRELEWVESVRGDFAAWALLAFGLVYLVWGLRRAQQQKPHKHWHTHADGIAHDHTHAHQQEHAHVHAERDKAGITPWALFLVFAFGPCEALIPLLMYPAAAANLPGMILVTGVFAVTTLLTMLLLVLSARWGLARLTRGVMISAWMQRHAHALAGVTICLCATLMLSGL